jgi:ankyrin repeat protein
LLELIFSNDCNISIEKLIEYIPILSSFCLNDKVRQLYLKLFGMMNDNNHKLFDELIDDMINHFSVEEINEMPDIIASKFILKIINGIDINKVFLHAVKIGYLETIKILINLKADIYFNDKAIILASLNGHLEIVKLLIDNGADIHVNTNH